MEFNLLKIECGMIAQVFLIKNFQEKLKNGKWTVFVHRDIKKASEGNCTPDLNPVVKPADGLQRYESAAIATMLRRHLKVLIELKVYLNMF